MNYPCENCIKADVCKYKENVKQELNTICGYDIITATYTCKYAKYNSIARFDTTSINCYTNAGNLTNNSTTAYRDDNSIPTIDYTHKDSTTNIK